MQKKLSLLSLFLLLTGTLTTFSMDLHNFLKATAKILKTRESYEIPLAFYAAQHFKILPIDNKTLLYTCLGGTLGSILQSLRKEIPHSGKKSFPSEFSSIINSAVDTVVNHPYMSSLCAQSLYNVLKSSNQNAKLVSAGTGAYLGIMFLNHYLNPIY